MITTVSVILSSQCRTEEGVSIVVHSVASHEQRRRQIDHVVHIHQCIENGDAGVVIGGHLQIPLMQA